MSGVPNRLMGLSNAATIQPDISLSAGRIGQGAEGGFATMNPMATLGGFARIQNELNQARLFNQTFGARQMMGEIAATSPDTETMLNRILQSPAAPFAGEFLNQIRQTQSTLTQVQGEQQRQTATGLEGAIKALTSVYVNPTDTQWQTAMGQALAPLSGVARDRVSAGIESLRQSITDNLPGDPAAARAVMQQRILGKLAQVMTPDQIRALSGAMPPQYVAGAGPQGQGMVIGGPAIPGAGIGVGGPSQGPGGGGPIPLTPGGAGPAPSPLAAPAAGTLLGPTTLQKQRYDQVAKDMSDLDDSVRTGQGMQQTMQEMRTVLQSFKPGGLAGTYAHAAQILQGLGASPELVNAVGNGSISGSQAFQKLALNLVTPQIRTAVEGIGRQSRVEFQEFTKRNPDWETDPGAIDTMLNWFNHLYQVSVGRQQFRDQFLASGGDPLRWPAAETQWMNRQGYTKQFLRGVGPTGSKVPGATPAAVAAPPPNALTAPSIDDMTKGFRQLR